MRSFITVLVFLTVSVSASTASADALSRKDVERRLGSSFKAEQSFRLTGMKENYWGIYRTYHVTFNLRDTDIMYRVGCDLVDRRPAELDLTACEATDPAGQKLSDSRARELGIGGSSDTARLDLKRGQQQRYPASVLSR